MSEGPETQRPMPQAHQVFARAEAVALAADEACSCAQNVVRLCGPASAKLWEMETDLRGATRQATSRMVTGMVNTLLSTVGLPSPDTLANQINQLYTATVRFERSCIIILTLGDDLRSLKAKEDLHMLLGGLLNAWDFTSQMQRDLYFLKNATLTYKVLDKMIGEIGKIKDFGGKAGGELTDIATSSKRSFFRVIRGKQTVEARDVNMHRSEELISSTAPRLRETLASINALWPGLLAGIEELKPYLEQLAARVDVALDIK